MPEHAPDPHAAAPHVLDPRSVDPQATNPRRTDTDPHTTDPQSAELLRRLLHHDADAPAEILARSATSTSPDLLVAAAILADRRSPALDRARGCATSSRERQLVALADARLSGDAGLLDGLARDILADHPDNLLAAWIADPDVVEERS